MEKPRVGNSVTGKIILITDEYIFLDIGMKSDGILPVKSLNPGLTLKKLKIGNSLEASITKITPDMIELSQVINKKKVEMDDIRQAFVQQLPIKGKVEKAVNGGFRINIKGKNGFCPISHINRFYTEQPTEFENKEFFFLIMDFDSESKNIVLSRKKYLTKIDYDNWKELSVKHQANPDETYDGKVVHFTDKGVLVEIQKGLTGFLPNRELSFQDPVKARQELNINDSVTVKIIKIDLDENKPGALFSITKIMDDNQWNLFIDQHREGDFIQGQIIRQIKGGFILELENGIQGYLSNQEINSQDYLTAKELSFNSLLDVKIKEIDKINKKIQLSLPEDPAEKEWQNYTSRSSSGFKPLNQKLKRR